MSDRWAVGLAAATAAGAHLGGGPPLVVAALLAAVAVASRRPWLLCLAAALLAASLADRARDGLDPVGAAPYTGWVTLAGDPRPLDSGGVAVVVRVEGRRVEAVAYGPPAWAIEHRLAGERVLVEGRLRPPRLPLSSWAAQRRIVGRLDLTAVDAWAPGSPLSVAANGVRRTLAAGAADLSGRARSLLAGIVLGDDRHQPPELADDFEAAGLTHLLVVSGANVAFALALVRPVLSWLPGAARAAATVAAVGAFVVLVRFEPSVLRAGAMTAVALAAGALGRPADGVRVAALAVTGLLLADPLLIRSVGFGLSVGASMGIVVLARPLAATLPGPRPLAEAVAVTLAAQAGALPVLLPAFGAVPVATVPANLLAVPVAGPLMMWGLTAGLAAGVAPGPARQVLHLPTEAMAWWLAAVAEAGARAPLGELRSPHAAALLAAGAVAVIATRRSWGGGRALAAAVAAVAIALPAVDRPGVPAGRAGHAPGVTTERSGGTTVAIIGPGARPAPTLEALRRSGARCVDAVAVAGDAGAPARRAAAALARRCPRTPVLAPRHRALPGWFPIDPGRPVVVGGVEVAVVAGGRLQVGSPGHGSPGHDAAPRAPPLRHHLPGRRRRHPEPHARLVLRQGQLLRVR